MAPEVARPQAGEDVRAALRSPGPLPCRDCGEPGIGAMEWCAACFRARRKWANQVIRRLERDRVRMVSA